MQQKKKESKRGKNSAERGLEALWPHYTLLFQFCPSFLTYRASYAREVSPSPSKSQVAFEVL